MTDIDLNKIPRRKRRFYRKEKIMHKMIKDIKKDAKLKLDEKKKILEALKKKLATTKDEELSILAERLFEQSRKKDLGKITAIEIQKSRIRNPSAEELNFDEVADNVYGQIMEEKEIEQWKTRHGMEEEKTPLEEMSEGIQTSEPRRSSRNHKHHSRREKETSLDEDNENDTPSIADITDDTSNKKEDSDTLSIADLSVDDNKKSASEKFEDELDKDSSSEEDDLNFEGLETDFGLDAKLKKKKKND